LVTARERKCTGTGLSPRPAHLAGPLAGR
jgi:hypothetical protein